MPEVGNWTIEQCATEGTDTLVLIGTDLGLARWRDSLSAGQVYYSIQDGINKEAGIGTFNGINQITRDTVTATLVNNVYDDNNPSPINLSGASLVASAFNTVAFNALVTDIEANADAIAINTSDIGANTALIEANAADIADNADAIALRATTDYVDAADALKYDKDGGVISGSVRIGDGTSGGSGVFAIRAYGIMDGSFFFLRPDESVAGIVRWVNDEESIDIIQYGYDQNLETIVSIKDGNVTLTGIDVLVPTNDKHLTHKKYVDDTFVTQELWDYIFTGIVGGIRVNGNLEVERDSAYAHVRIQPNLVGGRASVLLRGEGNPAVEGNLSVTDSTGDVKLERRNAVGTYECTLTLTDDGNITIDGATPNADDHLTRRDYVDGKFDDGLTGTYQKAETTSMTFVDGLLTAIN